MSDAETLSTTALFGVKGIVAVITGGATGIGLIMAKALAHNGAAKVYILGRRPDRLASAAASSPLANIIPIEADVTSKASLAAAAARVQSEAGHVDLLVANAGYLGASFEDAPPGMDVAAFKEYAWAKDPAEFAKTYEANCTGVYFTAIAFLELLDAGNKVPDGYGARTASSQIIVTGSVAAYLKEPPTAFAYSSSKAGATQLARNLGTYLSRFGIRTNVIAPGVFPTDLAKGLTSKYEDGKVPREAVPAGRFGTEEDMAGTLLYLASRAGAFTDGCVIVTDGGKMKISPAAY